MNRYADTLWAGTVRLFLQIEEMNLTCFVQQLVDIVRRNQETIRQIGNERKRNGNLLFVERQQLLFQYLATVNPHLYVIGSTGDNFHAIVERCTKQTPTSAAVVLRTISNLILDLITYTSSIVCPQCKSDHLRIVTDLDNTRLYEYCETCTYTEPTEDGCQQPKLLVPATIPMVKRAGYLK